MVTLLVCLVVVGGAMAAIVVVTMDDAGDQPATGDPGTDRAGPLHRVGLRAASYLVPSGPPARSRPRTPPEPDGVPAAPEAERELVPARPAAPTDVEAVAAPAPSGAGDVAASVAASPPAAPPQDGPTLEIEEDPTATMPIPRAAGLAHGDDTMAIPVPGATQARVEDETGPVLRRTLVDDPASRADADVVRTRSRRALRRLRGVTLLLVTMVGLGTLLAVTLVGLAALVAIGIRAALGT